MSKTNHQRDFIARKDPKASEIKYRHYCKISLLTDTSISASAFAGDSTCGKHGIAQKRRGAKKFVNSRFRFNDKQHIRKILKELD